MKYCLVQDLATLVWAANLADLELHTSLSLGKEILRPTMLVFDLDPGAPADIVQCCRVGLWVQQVFAELGLECCAKTSGSKGLQVYIPLNTPATYEQTKPFARAVARLFEQHHPQLVVSEMKKTLRVGKVFVDWSQNDDYKTTVCVYSLRAKEQPTVSAPVTWDEVANTLKKSKADLLVFDSDAVLKRADSMGDLFEPVLTRKQKLPSLQALEAAVATVMMKGNTAKTAAAVRSVPVKTASAKVVRSGVRQSAPAAKSSPAPKIKPKALRRKRA